MAQSDIAVARRRLTEREPEASVRDARSVLEGMGWSAACERGRHRVYARLGERPIIVPVGDELRLKRTFLQEICERLGLD